MSIRAYCRIPIATKTSVRKLEGSCPQLLSDLFYELEGASEIHIAAYLFNNPKYFEFLSNLTEKGCKIFITSLPLNGYSPKKIKVEGFSSKISGRDMAAQIYDSILRNSAISLRLF